MKTPDKKQLESFFVKYPIRHFDKGQIIIAANETPPGISYVVSGQIRQYDITDVGTDIVVDVLLASSVFPLDWATRNRESQYFYQALSPVKIRTAPLSELEAFLRRAPNLLYILMTRAVAAMTIMQRRMAHLMSGVTVNRVLFELITQGKRIGVKQLDGSYLLHLHEDELAQRAGLTRETINRELGKLKRRGLVEVDHRILIIKNLEEIEALLGSHL
jgi:CRP/FNR family transcriptional regulator